MTGWSAAGGYGRRRRAGAAIGALLVPVLIGCAAGSVPTPGGALASLPTATPTQPAATPTSVGSPAATAGLSIVDRIPVPGVGEIAAGDDALWVVDLAGTLFRVDPNGGTAEPIVIYEPTGSERFGLSGVAVGHGSVWVTNGEDGSLVRVDPATSAVVERIRLGETTAADGSLAPLAIAISADEVWVANHHGSVVAQNGSVVRVDPHTNEVTATVALGTDPTGGGPGPLALTDDWLWVGVASVGAVVRVDLQSTEVVDEIPAGRGCGSLLQAAGGIWSGCDEVFRVDASTGAVDPPIAIEGEGAIALAGDDDVVWARSRETGTLHQIDPGTMTVRSQLPLPPSDLAAGVALATGFGSIWTRGENELLRIDPTDATGELVSIGTRQTP